MNCPTFDKIGPKKGIIVMRVVKGWKKRTKPKNIISQPTKRILAVVVIFFLSIALKVDCLSRLPRERWWSSGVCTAVHNIATKLQQQQATKPHLSSAASS